LFEHLKTVISNVRESLWLLPALMSAFALVLVYTLLQFEGSMLPQLSGALWWIFSGDAETARDLLATLLSGMMTMTSLVVSITVVVLALAAGQLGPRLIWNFIGDRQIQIVLGLFVGTILYILVALRSLNVELAASEVPHLVVTGASVLSIVCVLALLFYVHKMARSIISDTVIRHVASNLGASIASNLPERSDTGPGPQAIATPSTRFVTVTLGSSGYVQVIDYDRLVAIAAEHDLLFRLAIRPGHFVLAQGCFVEMAGGDPRSEELTQAVRRCFVLGFERTPTQDVEYSLRHLVEIAVRALSPGVNDPFTAIAALDHLGAALEHIFLRGLPPEQHCDDTGRVRVLAEITDYAGMLDAALNQIRQAGAGNAAILIDMAGILGKLAPAVREPRQREALLRHLEMIERAGCANLGEPNDIADLTRTVQQAKEAIGRAGI
jgi:uncharacterized membrane protein